MHDVTVCVAHIPVRDVELQRALDSVDAQTYPAAAVIVSPDPERTGAAATKNRALALVETDWVTFLDDDDEFLPHHLDTLVHGQVESGADVVYSWPLIQGMPDPSPEMFGREFDPDELRRRSYLHTNLLVRTDIAQKVGGFQLPPPQYPPYDDHGFALALLDAGCSFHHVPQRTWLWNVNGSNTSGLATRW